MAPKTERRHHTRRDVHLNVSYRLDRSEETETHEDFVSDLSKGGLFIRTQHPPREGDRLHVHFAWSQGGPAVEATCEVTRVSPEGIGVQFVQMDSDSALLLNNFLAS
jgi:uncharacterized protein (TIGR02266 family)